MECFREIVELYKDTKRGKGTTTTLSSPTMTIPSNTLEDCKGVSVLRKKPSVLFLGFFGTVK